MGFQDKITGMNLQLPALDELRGLLREGDTVLVARFIRLGRSRDHVIHWVNSFHQRDTHFKAMDLGIDTTMPAGKSMLFILYLAGRVRPRKHPGEDQGWPASGHRPKPSTLTGISLSSVKRYRKHLQAKLSY